MTKEVVSIWEKFQNLTKSMSIYQDKLQTIHKNIENVLPESLSHIKNAFNLLIPILQLGAAV